LGKNSSSRGGHSTAAAAEQTNYVLFNRCRCYDWQLTLMELPPRSWLIEEQGWQFLTVPLLTWVLLVLWSQTPWLLQFVALTLLTVQPLLPDTLKYPRPQLVELAVPSDELRLLFAVLKPA
jgi:hypothetical protein